MPAIPPEELDLWRRAARISAGAREVGLAAARPGARRSAVAEAIERYIRDHGAEPAFPANLSRNDEAAHYTPSPEDEATLVEGDLLKVDVGAHIDGAVADTAATVEVGGSRRFEALRRSVTEAVEAGIREVRAGVPVDALSQAIERAIHARGLTPIETLTGHSIHRWLLHAGKSIPNVSGLTRDRLEEGEIIAIEPFATNGLGRTVDGPFGNIVRFRRDPGEDEAVAAGWFRRFRTLPFTARWIAAPERPNLRSLRRHLQTYPVFLEEGRGIVAQAEHTVLVTREGAEVLTRAPEGAA